MAPSGPTTDELSSAQSTADRFLGGGRRYSWMNGASTTSRTSPTRSQHRPRHAKSKEPQPSVEAIAQPTDRFTAQANASVDAETVSRTRRRRPSHASISTSPHLANQDTPASVSDITAKPRGIPPSPASSTEDARFASPQAISEAAIELGPEVARQFASQSNKRRSEVIMDKTNKISRLEDPSGYPDMNELGPDSRQVHRPAHGRARNLVLDGAVSTVEERLAEALRPGSLGHSEVQYPPVESLTQSRVTRPPNQPLQQLPTPFEEVPPQLHAWTQPAYQTQPIRPLSTHSQPYQHPRQVQSETAYLQQPAINMQWMSVNARLETLHRYREHIGLDNTRNSIENSRMLLLEDAVRQADDTYLAIHQVMCLYDTNPLSIPAELTTLALFPATMQILGGLLVKNQDLKPPNLVRWFSVFPQDMRADEEISPAVFQHKITTTRNFVVHTGQNWSNMNSICKKRMIPPLVREMVDQLGITSRILQKVVFRSVVRKIWPEVPGLVEDAERVLQAEQDLFLSRIKHSATHPYGKAEKSSDQQEYVNMYKGLYERYAKRDQVPGMVSLPLSLTSGPCEQETANRATSRPVGLQEHLSRAQAALPLTAANIQHPPRSASSHSLLASQPNYFTLVPDQQGRPVQIPHGSYGHTNPYLSEAQSLRSSSAGQTSSPTLQASSYHSPPQGQNLHFPDAFSQIRARMNNTTHAIHGGAAPRFASGPIEVQRPAQRTAPHALKPSAKLFFPPAGYIRALPTHPDWRSCALHLAHARDPTYKAASTCTSPLFRYVTGFAFEPRPFTLGSVVFMATFHLDDKDYAYIPIDVSAETTGDPPTRVVDESSIMYRLRCCDRKTEIQQTDDHRWAVSEHVLPPYLYFEINGKMLECRRKLHFKKDLPLDLTPHLRVGDNIICVRANVASNDPVRSSEVLIAIEKVGVTSYKAIMDSSNGTIARIPASRTLDSIKAQLSGSDDDDDDIAIVNANITIGLMDPFYGCKIFDVPVRGISCLHRECFDLETFLQTRTSSDSENASSPTVVDEWKCPICREDARPNSLVVDGFLAEVRESLAAQGLLDTRAIIVEADGLWRPRPEKEEKRNPDAEEIETMPPPPVDLTTTASARTIIDLDDD